MLARVSESGTNTKCRPSSGISCTATGTRQGTGVDFSKLCSDIYKGLGLGKGDLASGNAGAIPDIEFPSGGAHIARQSSRSFVRAHDLEDIARERVLKVRRVLSVECRQIGSLAAIKSLTKAAHMFGNRKITDSHFPQVLIEIAAERIEKLLTKGLPCPIFPPEPAQKQHQMQHNELESALHCVGHSEISIKRRGAGLRHDRAIQGSDGAAFRASPKRPQDHGDSPCRRYRLWGLCIVN